MANDIPHDPSNDEVSVTTLHTRNHHIRTGEFWGVEGSTIFQFQRRKKLPHFEVNFSLALGIVIVMSALAMHQFP